MKIYLDESSCKTNLKPFTSTRHSADIRIGIMTIREKWEMLAGTEFEITTEKPVSEEFITIDANIIPDLNNYSSIVEQAKNKQDFTSTEQIVRITYPWQIFQHNGYAITADVEILKQKRIFLKADSSNRLIDEKNIYIEEGAVISHSIINASEGPVYIGKNALMMEGCLIRGPFALGENAVLKMGSKIYGATTIGPGCVGGGEIKNSVMFEYSNKAHDGYLGDSVIGAWCNLGAGTTNSNVKNTGGQAKYITGSDHNEISVGTKGGLIMGDYSRSAINTSFNTGSIVGVCCNIFGSGYPEKFTEDFTWGNEKYILEKAIKDIRNWKNMKKQDLTEKEIQTLTDLYNSK